MSTTERPAPSAADADVAQDRDDSWLDGERLALRPEVERISGANDQQLLFSSDDGRYTRLSRSGAQLVKLLDGRRTGRQIVDAVAGMGETGAKLSPSVPPFLAELRQAGVLNVAPEEEHGAGRLAKRAGGPMMKRLPLTHSAHDVVVPVARLAERLPRPLRRAVLGLILVAALATAVVALLSGPSGTGAFVPAAIVVFLLQITVHELAHAYACERHGAPVREAGIGLMLGVIPVAYVDRTDAYRVRSRTGRAGIALAGPANDLVWTGACSAVVLATDGAVQATASLLLFFQVAMLAANLNLILPTDGAHAIEAMSGEMNFRGRASSYVAHRVLRQPLPSALASVGRRRRAVYVAFIAGATVYALLFLGLTAAAIVTASA